MLRSILSDLEKGEYHDERKGNVRFDELSKQWLEWKEPQVTVGTYRNYPSLLKTTLLPTFGSKKLNQITKRTVDIWWAKHSSNPVNRRNAYYLLRGILKQAVKWDLLAVVPIDIEKAGADASTIRPDWTMADFDAVLAHVEPFYRPALEVMFAGHYRLGELVALNGSDVRHGMVSSTRQRTAQGLTTNTKTKQHKTIKLMERGRVALASTPKVIGDAPLYPGERSHQMPRASLQRAWNAACEAARYSNFHIHDIRHISLSLVAEIGEDRKVIQQRAGARVGDLDGSLYSHVQEAACGCGGSPRRLRRPTRARLSASKPLSVLRQRVTAPTVRRSPWACAAVLRSPCRG